MKDFFSQQQQARRLSFRLIVLFALAVVGVIVVVYLAAALIYSLASYNDGVPPELWQPTLFLGTTVVTILVICLGSLWKIQALSEGGSAVARILGARPLPVQTPDPRERVLRNVVEEMAIASGVPVPSVCMMDNERGINAFAAGLGFDDAVVCVTRGAVELLDRDELQGVVAHEFSHILNGDMRLNLRLLGWLNGILLLGLAGKGILRGMRRVRGRGTGIIFLAAAALLVIGYVGYFFGRLIKCAVSRQREYLGDASAVQFTRNPEGLAGALKKIGGLEAGSRLDHPRADELSHLYFGNGLKESWLHLLDTHPPLLERIRRLEPGFNGVFPKVTPLPAPPPSDIYTSAQPVRAKAEQSAPLSGAAAVAMLQQVGTPVREHIDRARSIMADMPVQLRSAASYPLGACALVCGLLLDRNPAIRDTQMGIIESNLIPAVAAEVRGLSQAIDSLPSEAYLPLLDLALPALRTMSREQFLQLKENVARLIRADNRISMFEFMLRYLITRHLEPNFNPRRERPPQIYGLRGVQQQCSLVLTAMARTGQSDEEAARLAFERGARVLSEPRTEISFLPAGECNPSSLERAFWQLDGASLLIKRRLLASCLECLIHDERVTVAEIELFRAIADAVGCPVPPWLQTAESPVTGSRLQGVADFGN